MSEKVFISRDFCFEAAHHLPKYVGKCHEIHGHRFEGKVIVSGQVNSETGFVMDYSDLKKIIKEGIVDVYDHKNLNDYFPNPTAEIMSVHMFEIFFHRLRQDFPDVKLERVELRETQNSSAWVEADGVRAPI